MTRRIQLSRAKGWRMPAGAVKVDRSTRWGNPFIVSECREAGYRGTDTELALRCAEAFRAWLGPHWRTNWYGDESEAARGRILEGLPSLRGKDLACWCALDQPCHADVLIELADAQPAP